MVKFDKLTEEQREQRREYSRRYRAEHLEECRERERRYTEENREKKRAYQRAIPKEKWQVRNRKFKEKLKAEVYGHYGNKCSCCGEAEIVFLSIDHINGNGNKHRNSLGKHERGSSTALLIDIRRRGYPSEFQVLCMNCNCGKYRNGGICPHEERG